MGNVYRSLLPHQPVQRVLHLGLILRVESWGGLIEEQNSWLPQNGSCDGDSLFLPPRNMRSLGTDYLFESISLLLLVMNYQIGRGLDFLVPIRRLSNDVFVYLWKLLLVGIEISLFCSFLNLPIRNLLLVVSDVPIDGFVEENRLLADNSKCISEVLKIVVSDIDTLEQYLAIGGRIEAKK